MKRYLRLRHQLIPYLYTMNYGFHVNGEPVIQPMYYRNPEELPAYDVKNQYYFGKSMIVCPITAPADKRTELGCVKVWLPEGKYFDFFNGRSYTGGHSVDMYRDIENIPVLIKAGSIIPLADIENMGNSTENPENMEIRIYAGADGEFIMYEDLDGDCAEHYQKNALTEYSFIWGNESVFTIKPYKGDDGVIPQTRNYKLYFAGFNKPEKAFIIRNGCSEELTYEYDEGTHAIKTELRDIPVDEEVGVRIVSDGETAMNDYVGQSFKFLDRAQIEFDLKSALFKIIESGKTRMEVLKGLMAMDLDKPLLGALCEIITAD